MKAIEKLKDAWRNDPIIRAIQGKWGLSFMLAGLFALSILAGIYRAQLPGLIYFILFGAFAVSWELWKELKN